MKMYLELLPLLQLHEFLQNLFVPLLQPPTLLVAHSRSPFRVNQTARQVVLHLLAGGRVSGERKTGKTSPHSSRLT